MYLCCDLPRFGTAGQLCGAARNSSFIVDEFQINVNYAAQLTTL